MAVILRADDTTLDLCANALLNGNLVSFPTETVFGLGASIFDDSALGNIFQAKQRPKSDPLIVHIASSKEAEPLADMTQFQKRSFQILSEKFWPGPLTLIVKASHLVSSLVTAGGDCVGLRVPSNSVAHELLLRAKVPIAAPSANRFGHVSPTTAQHVFDDLGDCPGLLILDPQDSCSIGFESTVAKILENGDVCILRPGAVSSLEMKDEFSKNGVEVQVEIKKVAHKVTHKNQTFDAPGQLITHYSPVLESFMLRDLKSDCEEDIKFKKEFLNNSVLIDFEKKHIGIKNKVLCYFDLSPLGDTSEAGRNLFAYLRKAENLKEAQYILLTDLYPRDNEMKNALFDRIYRAASGKYVSIE